MDARDYVALASFIVSKGIGYKMLIDLEKLDVESTTCSNLREKKIWV